MTVEKDPRIIAHEIEFEVTENSMKRDTGAIRFLYSSNRQIGFIVTHKYLNKAAAIEAVAWHVTGAESVCIPVAGVRFEYLPDGSVLAEIHCLADSLLETAAFNFLSHPPRAEAFSMCPEILSERRRIAALAAMEHWPRFSHIGDVIRNALIYECEWAIPDLVQPCSSFDAQKEIKHDKTRSISQIAMTYLRDGLRKGKVK